MLENALHLMHFTLHPFFAGAGRVDIPANLSTFHRSFTSHLDQWYRTQSRTFEQLDGSIRNTRAQEHKPPSHP